MSDSKANSPAKGSSPKKQEKAKPFRRVKVNASGMQLMRDLRAIPCHRGVLGFADYVTHFAGAISVIRENEVSPLPPHKTLVSMVLSNAKVERSIQQHLENYTKTNEDITIDMMLEECVAVINFTLYQKGAEMTLQNEEDALDS